MPGAITTRTGLFVYSASEGGRPLFRRETGSILSGERGIAALYVDGRDQRAHGTQIRGELPAVMHGMADGDVQVGDCRILAQSEVIDRRGKVLVRKFFHKRQPLEEFLPVPPGNALTGCDISRERNIRKPPLHDGVKKPDLRYANVTDQFECASAFWIGSVVGFVRGNCSEESPRDGMLGHKLRQQEFQQEPGLIGRDGSLPSTTSIALQLSPLYTGKMAQNRADQAVHEAARAGLIDQLAEMLAGDPSLIDAKGMDARTPLHCAGTVSAAALLLEHGARIDARDEDHDSTPAQWRIGESPDVARFLLERGANPDIFLAAALGDIALAEKLIAQDRGCVAQRIGKAPQFPPIGYHGRGGTIYQWTLRFNSYPHQIALLKGNQAMFDFLYAASDSTTRLLVNCLLARRDEAKAIADEHPEIVPGLADVDRELVARYCWETNTNYEAVKLMLDLGFPVAHPERSHGYTPLHNAAWAGSGDLVELLIARGHPVDIRDPGHNATPLGYALHDCLVEKRHPQGEFARVIKALLEAGSPLDEVTYPTGDTALDEVLRGYF